MKTTHNKKAYHVPKVQDYGNIVQITEGAGSATKSDHGASGKTA
jgi:hypothetical protein